MSIALRYALSLTVSILAALLMIGGSYLSTSLRSYELRPNPTMAQVAPEGGMRYVASGNFTAMLPVRAEVVVPKLLPRARNLTVKVYVNGELVATLGKGDILEIGLGSGDVLTVKAVYSVRGLAPLEGSPVTAIVRFKPPTTGLAAAALSVAGLAAVTVVLARRSRG